MEIEATAAEAMEATGAEAMEAMEATGGEIGTEAIEGGIGATTDIGIIMMMMMATTTTVASGLTSKGQ